MTVLPQACYGGSSYSETGASEAAGKLAHSRDTGMLLGSGLLLTVLQLKSRCRCKKKNQSKREEKGKRQRLARQEFVPESSLFAPCSAGQMLGHQGLQRERIYSPGSQTRRWENNSQIHLGAFIG